MSIPMVEEDNLNHVMCPHCGLLFEVVKLSAPNKSKVTK